MIMIIIIIAYIFIGSIFGAIVYECFMIDVDIVGEIPVAVFSGIFWPVAILIWGGYYFAYYIISKIRAN